MEIGLGNYYYIDICDTLDHKIQGIELALII